MLTAVYLNGSKDANNSSQIEVLINSNKIIMPLLRYIKISTQIISTSHSFSINRKKILNLMIEMFEIIFVNELSCPCFEDKITIQYICVSLENF